MTVTGMTGDGEWNKIAALKGDDDRERYLIGVAYNNVVDNKLAQQLGFESANEFFAARLKEAAQAAPTEDGLKVRELSLSTLKNYGATAKAFDVNAFADYGYSNLFLLLRYCRAAALDPKTPLDQLTVRIPDAEGSFAEKPFPACSASDLRAGIRALRVPAEGLAAEMEEAIELLNVAVDVAMGAENPGDVRARVHGGKVLVTLDSVPFEQLEEVLWAMLEVLPKKS